MSNPDAIFDGQAETIDPLVGPDGTVYLKAAGDSLGVPSGASDPAAPQLVQVHVGFAATPTSLALVQGAGSLGAATYYYRISALTAAGETLACTEVALAIAATHGVVLTWAAVVGATGYRVYGRSTGAELFIAAVDSTLLTYTDSGAITPAGALPTANTARFELVTEQAKAGTATRSSVGDAAADTLVLAANALRKGATVFNESTAILYLGLGTTAASATNYTVQIPASGYYEVPFWFSGQIRGYWASDAGGNARVTELT
jgi:hypothetical protein